MPTTALSYATTAAARAYRDMPPLRIGPDEADGADGQRLAWARKFWHSQDEALRRRDRQIEENVRMLLGSQWIVWNTWLQRYLDVTEWMTDEERKWRQRPVVNRVLYWFMLTHARLTENPPVVTFQPSTLDRFDAMLAEVADPIAKTLWRDASMNEAISDLVAWMIPGGQAFLMSRIDALAGDIEVWEDEVELSLLGPDGQPVMGFDGTPISRVTRVPFDEGGEPLARLREDGEVETLGEPHAEPEGMIAVDVLSPYQARGEWGPRPWHQKSWHQGRFFLTPQEVYEKWGVYCEPDVTPADDAHSAGEMTRMLFGSGFFGAVEHQTLGEGTIRAKEAFVTVNALWLRPCGYPGMERRPGEPGGRLTIFTQDKVLRDGQRPADFRYTSPIRKFQFLKLPGRPAGSTPQEMLNPINRAENRGLGQILEHRNLVANPKGLIDSQSGLQSNQVTNRPGENYVVNKRTGVEAFEYVQPPTLSEDVYKSQEILHNTFLELGQVEGAEGRPPTRDPSGELVKELRFNSDRFLGPTARHMVEEIARLVEDWFVLLPSIWSREKVIAYAGEDQIVKTITVYPDLFTQGKVHVLPDVESMLPEGRGERQQRIAWMYTQGLLGGPPGTPPAVQRYWELSRFPHMGRANRPGGVHRLTAEREIGLMLQGVPALQIPIFEWYDPAIHLEVLEQFMASPEFLSQPPEIQHQLMLHRQGHIQQVQFMQARALAQQAQAARFTAQASAPPGNPDEDKPQPAPAAGPQSTGGQPAAAMAGGL